MRDHLPTAGVAMPDRLYSVAATVKPSVRDHVLAHPLDISVALFSFISGLLLLVSAGTGWDPSYPIAKLPEWGQIGVGIFLALGAVFLTLGLLWRGRMDTEWLLERLGLICLGTGWLCYSVAAATFRPGSIISAMLPAAVVAGYGLRFYTLHLIEHKVRKAISRRGGDA